MPTTKKNNSPTKSKTQTSTLFLLFILIACIVLIIGLFIYYLSRGEQQNIDATTTDLNNRQLLLETSSVPIPTDSIAE